MRWVNAGEHRILCFDIENKPGTYGPGDYTHPKVTAVAAQFLDGEMWSACLNRSKPAAMRKQAKEFIGLWGEATVVMGHNIKRHDIKILNGWLAPLDLPLLPARPMVDTYLDQPKMAGYSRSLENLAARYGCPIEKLWMPEHMWEQAYDGVPAAVARMRHRAESDVRINIWLYHELRRRNLLP